MHARPMLVLPGAHVLIAAKADPLMACCRRLIARRRTCRAPQSRVRQTDNNSAAAGGHRELVIGQARAVGKTGGGGCTKVAFFLPVLMPRARLSRQARPAGRPGHAHLGEDAEGDEEVEQAQGRQQEAHHGARAEGCTMMEGRAGGGGDGGGGGSGTCRGRGGSVCVCEGGGHPSWGKAAAAAAPQQGGQGVWRGGGGHEPCRTDMSMRTCRHSHSRVWGRCLCKAATQAAEHNNMTHMQHNTPSHHDTTQHNSDVT